MFEFDNICDGEEVNERCVLVSGRFADSEANGHVLVETRYESGVATFPEQRWPICQGWFKVLVMLSPGINKVVIKAGTNDEQSTEVCMCVLNAHRSQACIQVRALLTSLLVATTLHSFDADASPAPGYPGCQGLASHDGLPARQIWRLI
jgi:hypothetical protein